MIHRKNGRLETFRHGAPHNRNVLAAAIAVPRKVAKALRHAGWGSSVLAHDGGNQIAQLAVALLQGLGMNLLQLLAREQRVLSGGLGGGACSAAAASTMVLCWACCSAMSGESFMVRGPSIGMAHLAVQRTPAAGE